MKPAPEAGASSHPTPTGSGTADVLLLGFRNDLSRERVLAAAAAGHLGEDVGRNLDRKTPLPHALGRALPLDEAAALYDQIEHLGGQASLLSAEVPQPSLAPPPNPPQSRLSPLLALLLAAAVAAAYAFHRSYLPNPRPPLPREFSSQRQADLGGEDDSPATRLNRQAVALGKAERYADAVAKLREAIDLSPNRALLRRNLQVTLTNWAASQLRAGALTQAIDHFDEALRYGSHPETLTGLGIAELRAQDYPRAERYLKKAFDAGASPAAVLPALAEAYEKNGDRVHALEMLQRAQKTGVRMPGLAEQIERLSREVDAEWDFRSDDSRHFEIRFSQGESDYAARIVLRSLESAYETVGRKFGIYPEQRTEVVLYPEKDFHDITQTPEWAGAAFDGRIKLPIRGLTSDDDALDRIVRHEYAHSLIASLGNPNVPTWLNEGLAMWAEEESDGDRLDWARRRLAGHRLLTLAQLTAPFTGLSPDTAEAAYAQSYLTVWYMLDQYGARRIPDLLDALRREHSFATAFADVYPEDVATLEQHAMNDLAG